MDLRRANFTNAILREAKFHRSNLLGATFCGADLRGATFLDRDQESGVHSDAIGLSSVAFAGANLEGAAIPDSLVEFPQLHNAEEASKSGTTVIFSVVVACAFCILSCGTFTDADILTSGNTTAAIPGIGLALPVRPFLIVCPILLLLLQVYFLLLLQKYDELIAELPYVFPDGVVLPMRVYPWPFTSLAPPRDDSAYIRNPFEFALAVILAYLIVPMTIWRLWFRALCSHDDPAYSTLMALAFSIAASLIQFSMGRATLFSGAGRISRFKAFSYPRWLSIITAAAIFTFGLGIAITRQAASGSIVAAPAYGSFETPETHTSFSRGFLEEVGFYQVAHLTQLDVSKKPQSWTGRETQGEPELKAVIGADLQYKNLRYIHGYKTFLVNGRLEGADLTDAVLAYADLRGANLNGSQGREVDFEGATVSSISTKTTLSYAHFENARFIYTGLRGAELSKTDLTGAQFDGADLSGADFSGSNVTAAQLSTAAMMDERTRVSPPLTRDACKDGDSDINVSLFDERGLRVRNWAVVKSIEDRVAPNDKLDWTTRVRELPACPRDSGDKGHLFRRQRRSISVSIKDLGASYPGSSLSLSKGLDC
jgi:uncharacterized protein YjbI with pentapeptide repeats